MASDAIKPYNRHTGCRTCAICQPWTCTICIQKARLLMSNHPNDPAVLISVREESEAVALVAALADHGIDARTSGGLTATFRAEAPGDVRILVRNADLQQAQRALAEIDRDRGQVDWSTVDVGEPED